MTDVIRITRADGVAVLTLNRAASRNALSVELANCPTASHPADPQATALMKGGRSVLCHAWPSGEKTANDPP